jgi:hypothetical protein
MTSLREKINSLSPQMTKELLQYLTPQDLLKLKTERQDVEGSGKLWDRVASQFKKASEKKTVGMIADEEPFSFWSVLHSEQVRFAYTPSDFEDLYQWSVTILKTSKMDQKTSLKIKEDAFRLCDDLTQQARKIQGLEGPPTVRKDWYLSGEVTKDGMVDASLLEQLGGFTAVAKVVADFSDAVVKDELVGKGSANKDLNFWSTNMAEGALDGLKHKRTDWLCTALGGEEPFVSSVPGKCPMSLGEAHRHLHITSDEFDRVSSILGNTLKKHQVPIALAKKVLAAFDQRKPEIVDQKAHCP